MNVVQPIAPATRKRAWAKFTWAVSYTHLTLPTTERV